MYMKERLLPSALLSVISKGSIAFILLTALYKVLHLCMNYGIIWSDAAVRRRRPATRLLHQYQTFSRVLSIAQVGFILQV